MKLSTPIAAPWKILLLSAELTIFAKFRITVVAPATTGPIAVKAALIPFFILSKVEAIEPKPAFLNPWSIYVSILAKFLITEFFKFANDVPIPALFFLASAANPLDPPFNLIKASFSWSTEILPLDKALYRSISADLPVKPNDFATARKAVGMVSIRVRQDIKSTLPVDIICVYC